MTRKYHFTLTRAKLAPDGFEKDVILVNNQFPGPLVEANWGDWIEVVVDNQIYGEESGTAIHWHGLQQKGTPWMDGVPGVTQCGIIPGKSFTYRFRADRFGTSWWHSHYQGQYVDGLIGPIVIYGPEHQEWDEDLGTFLLHDWRHRSYEEVNDAVLNVRIFDLLNIPKLFDLLPPGDGNLINGKAFTLGVCVFGIGPGCNQDFNKTPKWTVEKGKKYKLRIANVGGDGTEKFSIDGHRLTVMSTDFTQIEPYETDIVTVGVGQRADVILTANNPGNRNAFWVRVNVAWCSLTWKGSALAALYYAGADTTKQPTTDPVADPFILSTTALCGNDPIEQSKPWYPMDAVEPTTTLVFNNFYTINSTGHLKFAMTFPGSYSGNYSEPALYKAAVKGEKFTHGLEWDSNRALFNPDQVYDVGDAKIVRIVVNNPTFAQNAHAMHLHGHDFQVISNGVGFWDGKVQKDNPMRRDTQIVVPDGHLVFQYEADNPGLWALHCHIPWHVADGLVVNFMVSKIPLRQAKSAKKSTASYRRSEIPRNARRHRNSLQ